jgi:hypothetical protein
MGVTTKGQCCDPLGMSTTLPACNAYRLVQDFVAAAAEIDDNLVGEDLLVRLRARLSPRRARCFKRGRSGARDRDAPQILQWAAQLPGSGRATTGND